MSELRSGFLLFPLPVLTDLDFPPGISFLARETRSSGGCFLFLRDKIIIPPAPLDWGSVPSASPSLIWPRHPRCWCRPTVFSWGLATANPVLKRGDAKRNWRRQILCLCRTSLGPHKTRGVIHPLVLRNILQNDEDMREMRSHSYRSEEVKWV